MSIEATSISTLRVATPLLTDPVPVYELNAPRTLETITWRTLKPTRLWDGSRVNVPFGNDERTDMKFPFLYKVNGRF